MQGVLNVHAILSVHCLFKLHGTNNFHMFSSIQGNLVVVKSDTLIVEVTQLWQVKNLVMDEIILHFIVVDKPSNKILIN